MNKSFLLLPLTFLMACKAPAAKQQTLEYPDIKGYFKKEIRRLEKKKPLIEKTVHLNTQKETNSLTNIKWNEELSLFLESDINKPAFKGLYKKGKQEELITFTALDEKLKTREIEITYSQAGTIKRIAIKNHTQNNLFTSDEFLEYYPDSLYQIVKRQEVKVLGTNNYWILGEFKK